MSIVQTEMERVARALIEKRGEFEEQLHKIETLEVDSSNVQTNRLRGKIQGLSIAINMLIG